MTSPNDPFAAKRARIEELHRCQAGRTALLVIDMQHGFLDEGASLEVPKGREMVPRVRRLIDTCRSRRVPVIYTQFVYCTAIPCLRGDPFGPEHLPSEPSAATGFGRPSDNCLIGPRHGRGVESADIIDELSPRPDELVVPGHTYDKFHGTPLDLALRCHETRQLLVTGVTTDVCVNATLIAAAMRDYRVTAVTDAVATIDEQIQEACFKIWQNKFARLRASDELVEELMSV
jgi:ureidoacrylate peracid hydrolase